MLHDRLHSLRKPCASCGVMYEPAPDDAFHVAIHDCETGEWQLVTMLNPATRQRLPFPWEDEWVDE